MRKSFHSLVKNNTISQMEHIFETNRDFEFDKVTLLTPTASNGNHFIKFMINELPLYIQPPKCKTKLINIKNKKKYKYMCICFKK